MIGWILFFAFMELYSVGMCVFLKKLGVKKWFLCLVPFAVFYFAQKFAGVFKILAFPVKKWGNLVISYSVVTMLAYMFGVWAIANQDPQRVHFLLDILWLVAGVCIGIVWLGISASTAKIFSKVYPYNSVYAILSYLLLPIPFLLIFCKVKPEKAVLFEEYSKAKGLI